MLGASTTICRIPSCSAPGLGNAILSIRKNLVNTNLLPSSQLHMTSILDSKKAGRYKATVKKDNPLTYEMAQKPDMIGVRKAWNTYNTSGLKDGIRKAETAQEDIFIRKFVHGTWPDMVASDVVIKRRANMIILNFFVVRKVVPLKMYFLIGYTEEILSYVLKSIVRLELQTIDDSKELVYKYI